jgi:PHP family Zn ribbon phosphoesterase
MVLRFKSTMHRTAKNIPMYAYKRTVESITLNDLVDPVFIEQAKYALEAQNKRNNLSKLVTNTGEEKVSHIRIINLLSDPTKEQIKTLQAADEARREDNRKKKHRVNIGGSYSMMGYA